MLPPLNAKMPIKQDTKAAYNKVYYERTKQRRRIEAALGVVFEGGQPQSKTMTDLGWHEDMITAIRNKDRRAFGKLELEHGIAEDFLFDKFKDVEVKPVKRPHTRAAFESKNAPTVKACDQCLDGSITWEQMKRFWEANDIRQFKLVTFQAVYHDTEHKEPVLYSIKTDEHFKPLAPSPESC